MPPCASKSATRPSRTAAAVPRDDDGERRRSMAASPSHMPRAPRGPRGPSSTKQLAGALPIEQRDPPFPGARRASCCCPPSQNAGQRKLVRASSAARTDGLHSAASAGSDCLGEASPHPESRATLVYEAAQREEASCAIHHPAPPQPPADDEGPSAKHRSECLRPAALPTLRLRAPTSPEEQRKAEPMGLSATQTASGASPGEAHRLARPPPSLAAQAPSDKERPRPHGRCGHAATARHGHQAAPARSAPAQGPEGLGLAARRRRPQRGTQQHSGGLETAARRFRSLGTAPLEDGEEAEAAPGLGRRGSAPPAFGRRPPESRALHEAPKKDRRRPPWAHTQPKAYARTQVSFAVRMCARPRERRLGCLGSRCATPSCRSAQECGRRAIERQECLQLPACVYMHTWTWTSAGGPRWRASSSPIGLPRFCVLTSHKADMWLRRVQSDRFQKATLVPGSYGSIGAANSLDIPWRPLGEVCGCSRSGGQC